MPRYCYINGRYIHMRRACISLRDRGLQFSDGAYDVMYFCNNHIIDAEAHFDSLCASLSALHIQHKLLYAHFCLYAHQLMDLNRRTEGLVYTQISRGNSRRVHALNAQPEKPNIFMYLETSALLKKPRSINVKSMADIRWGGTYIKSLNILGNIVARQQALDEGCGEALMYLPSGLITEAGSANVFFVVNDTLYTPPADGHIFPGVTRARNICLAAELGFDVIESSMSIDAIKVQASEMFLSTTSVGVMPVTHIDNVALGNGDVGAVSEKMRQAYYDFVAQTVQNVEI